MPAQRNWRAEIGDLSAFAKKGGTRTNSRGGCIRTEIDRQHSGGIGVKVWPLDFDEPAGIGSELVS